MENYSVLLVDDDEDIIEFLEYNFKKEGYVVYTAMDGISGLKLALEKNPSVIILDIMMKGMDGIQLCEELHKRKVEITGMKMFLTARGEDFSQIAGFDSGADDFVVKPINPKVLIKRVEALLRRNSNVNSTESSDYIINIGNLKIDKEQYIVWKNGKSILLPRKEFKLLEMLASKPGKVFHRDEIYDLIWGDAFVGDRTIDVHIRKLREKIGDNMIVTVKGVGYKLEIGTQ
ncbi:MAG TPA: response regulator transcription factor [Bacteroidales bacterium]|nr:response regulator transcription factor [Bacteroidales bacterium]